MRGKEGNRRRRLKRWQNGPVVRSLVCIVYTRVLANCTSIIAGNCIAQCNQILVLIFRDEGPLSARKSAIVLYWIPYFGSIVLAATHHV